MIKVELIIVGHVVIAESRTIKHSWKQTNARPIKTSNTEHWSSVIKKQLISNVFAFVCNNNI